VNGALFLKGPWSIEVSSRFPVEVAEYYGGVYYVIYPYACPSFDYELHGRRYSFMEHKWVHPLAFRDQSKYDGLMILSGGVESRAKKVPSCEIQYKMEVWEVALAHKGVRMIRPRPGKKPSFSPIHLAMEVTMSDVLATFPRSETYTVRENREGDFVDFFQSSHTGRDRRLVIDFGCRLNLIEPHPIVLVVFSGINKDPPDLHLPSLPKTNSSGTVSSSMLDSRNKYSYTGSKLVVYVRDTNSLAFYKEEGKRLDFVGGTQEFGETPLDCLKREVKEETGVSLDVQQIVYLGESNEKITSDLSLTIARSYVYLLSVSSDERLVENMIPLPLDLVHKMTLQDYQPWVIRIMRTVKDSLGSLENLKYIDKTITISHGLEMGDWLRQYRAIPTVMKNEVRQQSAEWRQQPPRRARIKFQGKRPKKQF
jgi:hypothetical protein